MCIRASLLPWLGRPHEPPRLVVHTASGRRLLYASWNGATEVAAWRLEVGSQADDLQVALTKSKKGFETSLPLPPSGAFAAAVALGPHGDELGRSKTIQL
jgi:hypothetical protein